VIIMCLSWSLPPLCDPNLGFSDMCQVKLSQPNQGIITIALGKEGCLVDFDVAALPLFCLVIG
jgi:hypothetical protein